jgi:26S proteasome regulatory subunit N2
LVAYQLAFDCYENAKQEFVQKLLSSLPDVMDTDDNASPIGKIRKILAGKLSIELHLEFLFRNNKTDLLILKKTKTSLDGRNSMYHSAISFANAFMNAGTSSDQFLRDSMDWMSKASNWAKFSATAQLGVIHRVC